MIDIECPPIIAGTAPRLQWSSFCETKCSKKAGTEDGNVRQKKI